MTEAK